MIFSDSLLGVDNCVDLVAESSRAQEGRVVCLEQDHSRLSSSFKFQSADTAKFVDFQINIRNKTSSWPGPATLAEVGPLGVAGEGPFCR